MSFVRSRRGGAGARAGATSTLLIAGLAGVSALILASCRASAPAASTASAATSRPTFAQDVAPIVFHSCAGCHRPGGLGPFSLLDYASAKEHAAEIADVVAEGVMPPWHADAPHGVFRNDRRLSNAAKEVIARWVATGAAPGDLSNMPPRPQFESGWEMGKPDAVLTMEEEYTVPAHGTIEYQYFEVPTDFTDEKWVQAIEIMPGARPVVHHVLVYARIPAPPEGATPSRAGTGAQAPQGPLFSRPQGHGVPRGEPRADPRNPRPRQLGALIGATAPGTNLLEFAPGTALRIRPGTVLTFQMHYTASGHEMKDRTSVGFRFASAPPGEEVFVSSFVNGSFVIPPGAKDVSVATWIGANRPVRIWGLLPHTHLRGTRWKYTLTMPDSTSSVVLDVPRYDFNWQTYYLFAKPLELPPGARLESVAWYDNSATNPHNPDPTKEVRWGDQTWEEMQYTSFLYSVPARR